MLSHLLDGMTPEHQVIVKEFLSNHESELLQSFFDPVELATKSMEYFLDKKLIVKDARTLSIQIEKKLKLHQVQQQVSI